MAVHRYAGDRHKFKLDFEISGPQIEDPTNHAHIQNLDRQSPIWNLKPLLKINWIKESQVEN